MQKFIYYIINKLFMNEVEGELLDLFDFKKKIVFDVGCNRGNFTKNVINLEKKNVEQSQFYLFDPNPNIKNYLHNLLKNKNVEYFPLALDDTNMKKKFTINRYFEASGSSLKSAHKDDKLYNLSRKAFMKLFRPFKKIKDYESIDVQTQTLDNFCSLNNIERIDLLKLDTDGNEYEILRGAEKLLSQDRIGIIYTEISGLKKEFDYKVKKIVELLDKYNFELKKVYKIRSVSLISNLKATDNLFVKK